MVKLADTLDLGSSSRECRFKSCYPHQKSKLFSPACEHVLGAHGAPAELRRRKEFFLIFAELKLRCGNVVYMKRRVWFLIVTKPLLPAFGQVGEKNPFFRRTNKSSDRKRSCGTTAGEGIFSLHQRHRKAASESMLLFRFLVLRAFWERESHFRAFAGVSRGPAEEMRSFATLRRIKEFSLY